MLQIKHKNKRFKKFINYKDISIHTAFKFHTLKHKGNILKETGIEGSKERN